MIDKEKVIDGIVESTKDVFLEDVDPEIHEKMLVAYKQYLVEEYGTILDSREDEEKMIRICSKMEKVKWQGKSTQQKLSTMIKDEALNKLKQISSIAYKQAQRKMGFLLSEKEYIPTITEEETKKYIEQMEQLLDKVKPFNIYIAQQYYSEGLLDFQFAANMTEDTSLRTARMK